MFNFLCCCKNKPRKIKPLFRDVAVNSPVPSNNSQVFEQVVFFHKRSQTGFEAKRRSLKNLSTIPKKPIQFHPLHDYVYPRERTIIN